MEDQFITDLHTNYLNTNICSCWECGKKIDKQEWIDNAKMCARCYERDGE